MCIRDSVDAAYTTSDLTNDECDLIHASLAHCSASRMQLAKHHGYGALQGYKHDPAKCTACLANKRKKSIAKTSGKVYTYFGECVCSDICGEFPESPHGFKYACNFYDRYSHMAAVYFCKTKNAEEIKRCHDTFISDHRQYLKDGKISTWVTDDGLNFHSQSLDQMCVELSTRRAFAIPHVKEKHGAAERLWGMLLSPSRKMHWHAVNDSGKDGLWPLHPLGGVPGLLGQLDFGAGRMEGQGARPPRMALGSAARWPCGRPCVLGGQGDSRVAGWAANSTDSATNLRFLSGHLGGDCCPAHPGGCGHCACAAGAANSPLSPGLGPARDGPRSGAV